MHMKKSKPKLSDLSIIIVTALQRFDDLYQCLESLSNQKTDCQFDILVVVHEDKQYEIQSLIDRGLNIQVLKSPSHNYCVKRNVGARGALGGIVAYIDDDVILKPGWVKAILDGFRSEWTMAGGPVEPIFETAVPERLRGMEKYIGGFNCFPEEGYATETVIGCNMFFNRQWLLESGGFDEYIGEMNMTHPKMFYGGDELDVKNRLNPDQIGCIPDARLCHHIQAERISLDYIYKKAKLMGRAKHYIDQKQRISCYHLVDKYKFLFLSLIKMKNRIRYKKKYHYINGYFSNYTITPS